MNEEMSHMSEACNTFEDIQVTDRSSGRVRLKVLDSFDLSRYAFIYLSRYTLIYLSCHTHD